MLNVDSQASFDNILINVIGEISNKSEPSRKFVQTFVLAEQPNGYYVLNDIFRYLTEEEEEIPAEEAAPAAEQQQEAPEAPAHSAAPEAVPEAAPVSTESQVDNEPAATKVDEKLEEAKPNGETVQPTAAPQTNGDAEKQEAPAAPAPAPAAEAESTQPEYPPSPEPTPTASAPKEAPAAEKEAPAPAKAVPKTWANIASKPGAAVPVVPAIPVAAPKAPAQSATPAQPQPQSQQAAPATPAAESTPSQPSSNDTSGWQTAGHDHKKTQSRVGEENTLAYIKNVNEKVDASLLKQTLFRFGKLKHFDVNRVKVRYFFCFFLSGYRTNLL